MKPEKPWEQWETLEDLPDDLKDAGVMAMLAAPEDAQQQEQLVQLFVKLATEAFEEALDRKRLMWGCRRLLLLKGRPKRHVIRAVAVISGRTHAYVERCYYPGRHEGQEKAS